MFTFIDDFLNRITMYRLVLYYVIGLLAVALIFSIAGLLPFSPLALLFSVAFLTTVCYITNVVFAWAFDAPTNVESVYITALILALIISPIASINNHAGIIFLGWAACWSIASKFILAIRKKHLFNPAAFAVALTAITLGHSASWWVGTSVMLPFVIFGGVLMVRKLRRWDLVVGFLVTAALTMGLSSLFAGNDPFLSISRLILASPLFFFAFVMLTEPLTTPPTREWRIVYGVLVGWMFAPPTHIGPLYFTPELALLVGNLFSYIVSPKFKLMLTLKAVEKIADDTYDYVFARPANFVFRAGQYLEWTIKAHKADNRGNRRYFTIASAPSEGEVRMGVKFYPNASTFKQQLLEMKPGDQIVASQLAGDFTLPKDPAKKLVFIAGGIGVTPFRSMIQSMVDNEEKRDVTFFYANRSADEIAYKGVFDRASKRLGMKTIYTLTRKEGIPNGWQGAVGYVDEAMIKREVPDYQERYFYISGPQSMITSFKQTLHQLGVSPTHVKTDFFPGFA